jgi:YD repeat-containing protein
LSHVPATPDGNDKPIKECDALDRCTLTTHDSRGNVAQMNYANGSVETMSYDANGNLITQTDRAGRVTQMTYDRANRLIETSYPDANGDDVNAAINPRMRSIYDDAGQMIESIDENGNATTFEYDAAGRRTPPA